MTWTFCVFILIAFMFTIGMTGTIKRQRGDGNYNSSIDDSKSMFIR